MTNQQVNHDNSIAQVIEMANSSDVKIRIKAAKEFRELLSEEDRIRKQEIIDSGLVKKFVEFLQIEEYPDLQFEACWSLTNITAGTTEETELVIDAGAIPILIKLISCNSEELQEQAVWTLGNIAGDCPENRDLVLKDGILVPLLRYLWKSEFTSAIKNAVWTLANLCRVNDPSPDYEELSLCLPVLSCMLFHNDEDVLVDVCEALADFAYGTGGKIRAVIGAGVCKRLIELLAHNHRPVMSAALRTLCNIITVDDAEYTQMIIDHLALPKLLTLLTSSQESTRRLICRTISNVAAGNEDQKQAVIDAGIVSALVVLLEDGEIDTKKSAALAIIKLSLDASPEQTKYIVTQGCIPPLMDLLTGSSTSLIEMVLIGLTVILRIGELKAIVFGGFNAYAEIVRNCKGLDNIVQLKNHIDDEIRSTASVIIDRYFSREDAYPGVIADFLEPGAVIHVEDLPI